MGNCIEEKGGGGGGGGWGVWKGNGDVAIGTFIDIESLV